MTDFIGDIKNARLLYAKGGLMLTVGLLASLLLILHCPEMKTAILLVIAIWGFCRAYYFAFYVIQHYIDSDYKYAGLTAFLCHAVRNRFRK